MRRGARREDGAATVFGVATMAMLLFVAVACCVAGSVVVTHRRAESAADLAALAAAQAVQDGRDGCAAAGSIATANGARVESCTLAGFDAIITVRMSAAALLGGVTLPARARAGPGAGSVGVGASR